MKKVYVLMIALTVALSVNAQEYIDLGLSVNWASCNLGATSPVDDGVSFVSGTVHEFTPGLSVTDITIYDHNEDYSGNPLYDAATFLWGTLWRTPTYNEWVELMTQCTWVWCKFESTTGLKIKGYEITGPNGNKIFLPARTNNNGKYINGGGYMCSTPINNSVKMNIFQFTNKRKQMGFQQYIGNNLYGFPVRAVSDKK